MTIVALLTGLVVGLLVAAAVWYMGRRRAGRTAERIADLDSRIAQLNDDVAAMATARDVVEAESEARATEARDAKAERDGFRELLDAAPFAVWTRGTDLKIAWTNRTYRNMVGADAAPDADEVSAEIGSSIDPDQPRRLAGQALEAGEAQNETRHFVINGDRRALEIVEAPLVPGGALGGYAHDVTDLEESQGTLARHIEAHGEVLENLATAIAIYGPDKRLMFFNRAYSGLWRLDEEFLDQAPHINEVLDAQRAHRRLPEQADFRAYKEARNALFTNVIAPQEELVQLPDETMLRNVITPHPFGGLLFMFEDVTDKLVLERARNTLIAVQRATLDNLYEAVAVFGSDGRLKLFNSAYAGIWRLDEDYLQSEPHVAEIVDRTLEQLGFGPEWQERRGRIIADATAREGRTGRMYRPDGTVIDYAVVPLPDGQTLFTYLDVSDSQRIERALRERNEALEAADQLKSEFIANVSYELRTPLNTIIGFTEILKNQYFGTLNERQLEYADDVLDASQQLLMLINAILDLASIEAGYMALEPEPFDLHATVESVLKLATGRAFKQNLSIRSRCPADIGQLTADERRIKQVLFNLVSNSLKFTPNGGTVTVGAAREGDEVAIWVADTGIGIPEDDQGQVFDKFYKSAQDTRRGAGLGLSLVRSFVELHGGRVDLESVPGEGTKVTCRLPAAPATAEPAPRTASGD